ncbi:MAG: Transcriptional regulator, ArsR family, partial [uncultured Friedmanniella sp.]
GSISGARPGLLRSGGPDPPRGADAAGGGARDSGRAGHADRHDADGHEEAHPGPRGRRPGDHREGRADAAVPPRHRTAGRGDGLDQPLPTPLGTSSRRSRALSHPAERNERM